ncbi:MAG: fibronectin type III domain-containing protein [Lachnospiraceae bacterium]|nr:fibronectin type III domain-containing protein [Lachnospiraceae bacterium]
MKNRFWKSIAIGIGTTTFALAFTMLGKIDVHAATAATNITQTEGTSSSIEVEWTGGLDDSKYSVQMSEDQKNWHEMRSTTSKNCNIYSGISAGKTYYLKVITTAKDGTTAESMPTDVVSAPSAQPENLKWTDSTTSSVTLKWDTVEGANCYGLKQGSKDDNREITEDLTYTIKGLSNTFSDYINVSAGRKSSQGYVAWGRSSTVYSVKTVPGKITGIKKNYWNVYSKKTSSLWLDYNSVTNAGGYQFKIYNTKNKLLGTYESSYNWINICDLSGRSCVTVIARPYIKIGDKKKYGAWTAKKWIVPNVYGKYTTTSGKIKINWEKVTGATGYDIYVKTDRNGVYKKVASVKGSKSSYILRKFKGKKISRSKTYYVTVEAKKKVGNKTYKSSSQ